MPLDRRQFCTAVGAAGISSLGLSALAQEEKQAEASRPLRVIAYNVLVCRGWPSDRPLAVKAKEKGQMARRLAMELALYEPDIVNFSESPSEEVAKEVAGYLGMHHIRFPTGEHWPGTLLTRLDVIESENCPLGRERPKDLFTRHWGRAKLKLPSGDPLIVHSAHLFPQKSSPLRLQEIKAMQEAMKKDFDSGASMILMGDLNHTPDMPEYKLWVDAGWTDTFAQVGKGEGLTYPADKPDRRIDYVMARGPIAKRIVESRPLYEGAYRLNLADDQSFALSDHVPQLAVFDLGK
jgi:endonuclease/exonuclease/phosphatase family metal-dependent hydrolase